MRDDFCIFILSHDRAGNIPTVDLLKRRNYSGDWYIIIDNPDDVEPYKDEYGEDRVIYFDKEDTQPKLDRGDNFDRRNSILYARYYSFQIARDLGYDYFLQLDDDYTNIQYRFDSEFDYNPQKIANFDRYLMNAIEFLEDSGIDAFCMAQGGDFIGGEKSSLAKKVQTKRKAMNSYICKTEQQFNFRGTINEDVNTYTRAAQYGKLFLTSNIASIEQPSTQQEEGGLTEMYLDEGTYIKSFYTVLYSPSCTSLTKIQGRSAERIHHRINWRNAVPKIVPESTKQSET